MSKKLWTAVDQYTTDLLLPSDPALDAALASSEAAGLPSISVSPSQGKLLMLLAQLAGAKQILEIGTLGGYSSIWLARALAPGGRLITLEANPKHAEVARGNIARAGLAEVVEVRLGDARAGIQQLAAEGRGPFDLIFIDADKQSIPHYLEWSLKLSHRGSLIIVDNVIRDGALIDAKSEDPNVLGARRMHEMLAAEPRVSATTIQTVGSKGYDGLTLALVIAGYVAFIGGSNGETRLCHIGDCHGGGRVERRGGTGDGAVCAGVLPVAEVHAANGTQLALTQTYFEHALIPALNRMGITPVGAFKLDVGPETPTYYLLIPATSVETLVTLELAWQRIRSSSKHPVRFGQRRHLRPRSRAWKVRSCQPLRVGQNWLRRRAKRGFFSCAPTRAQAMRHISGK